MSDNEQVSGGTKFTTIQVTAATPAVLETLCARITDEVLRLIPEGSIEKIAKEVLQNGIVLQQRDQWGGKESKCVDLALMARERLSDQLRGKCRETLDNLWKDPKVVTAVEDTIKATFVSAMESLPRMVSSYLVDRMAYRMTNPNREQVILENLAVETSKLRSALVTANIPVETRDVCAEGL
jgi:hypothetical protein